MPVLQIQNILLSKRTVVFVREIQNLFLVGPTHHDKNFYHHTTAS